MATGMWLSRALNAIRESRTGMYTISSRSSIEQGLLSVGEHAAREEALEGLTKGELVPLIA